MLFSANTVCLRKIVPLFLVTAFIFTACKKDKKDVDQETLLKDSVYLYTKEVYLWQDALPADFKPRNYSTAEDVLDALKQYKKDGAGKPIDRYSFLDREGAVSGEIQDGVLGDFGFNIRYQTTNDLRISYVYEGSPAAGAQIQRSWKILKINGNASIDYETMSRQDFAFIYSALGASEITLTLQKPDNTQTDVNLRKAVYAINPVLYSHVYERNGKKIGYIVFNSFVSVINNNAPTLTKSKIDNAFSAFNSAGVSEVIVDLRYNGGGSVETAEYLTNLLVPSSANSRLMYSYRLNSTLTSYMQSDEDWRNAFASVNISKAGTLNPEKIYFIVTEGTASASELLINNLKPYVSNIKLIGEGHTYGKPVGFFPIPIFDTDLYSVSFETLNGNGQGQYYSGIPVDKSVGDDLTKNWGDENEACLSQALYYSQNGSFRTIASVKTSSSEKEKSVVSSVQMNRSLDTRGNRNMFTFDKKVKVDPQR